MEELLTARNMWNHVHVTELARVLQGFGASRTVARQLRYRSYDALPRWVKTRLKADARAARALVHADAKRKQEASSLPRIG